VKPTPRQREVILFLAKRELDGNIPPTLREIGGAFGINSTNGVNDHLRALERRGLIQRTEMRSRAIRLTPAGWQEIGEDASNRPPSDVRLNLLEDIAVAAQRLILGTGNVIAEREEVNRRALDVAVRALVAHDGLVKGRVA
jgi:SOS-response transcriptional repressor LexA